MITLAHTNPSLVSTLDTDPEDYEGSTLEEAESNPVQQGLTPMLLETCMSITIVDDLVDGEGSEQFSLSLVFSLVSTNVNVEGCPANVTIRDRRTCAYL